MARRAAPAKHYVFTLNNPLLSDADMLAALRDLSDHFSYCVFQREAGDEGTVHLQGYVEFNKKLRITQIAALLAPLNGAHWEKRRGTRQQARDYCMKDDTRLEGHVPQEVHCPRRVLIL